MGYSRWSNKLITCVNRGSYTLIISVQIFSKSILPFLLDSTAVATFSTFPYSPSKIQNQFMLHNFLYITSFHPGVASIEIPQQELSKNRAQKCHIVTWGATVGFFCAHRQGVNSALYINVSHFLCFLFILKRARFLFLMVVIVIYIYKQKDFFAKRFCIHKTQTNQSFLRKEYIYLTQKPRALLSNKNGILHY